MQIGTMSINMHVNFTNYGSALQTWALHRAIKHIGDSLDVRLEPVLVDYCPDCLAGKNPLNPLDYMWDADEDSIRNCRLSLPAIQVNADKFDRFYNETMTVTKEGYTSGNFDQIVQKDGISAFVCGSDTIFCPDEFEGFERGYYADYPCMQKRAVAYAPSFGDPSFGEGDLDVLEKRLNNFLAIGLREDMMLPFVESKVDFPVSRVVDPTLLFEASDYDEIADPVLETGGEYLLLYSRRYDPAMEACAERLAADHGWKIVEISLRAENAAKHRMAYDAGVEEFLSLVKNAQFLVTNSFHGMIFAFQYKVPFFVFSREQANSKIKECLELLDLSDRSMSTDMMFEGDPLRVDWDRSAKSLAPLRAASWVFLSKELTVLVENCRES